MEDVRSLRHMPVELLHPSPNNPRKHFVDADLDDLARSIREKGLLQPLVVRPVGERFQLIAGERRLRAARAAGLNAVPVTSGSTVQFSFNSTRADGTNTLANDPLDITACDNNTCPTPNNFGSQFCGGDWVIKLAPISYQVDASNPANPKLSRTQNGTTSVVTEQLIGFKVGATIWNNTTATVSTQYNYDASTYMNNTANDQAWNFTLVRSVRISVIP